MGLRSFKSEEQSTIATSPNFISLVRGVGGVALGWGLAVKGVDPEMALTYTGLLVASDAEGLMITATRRFPRLQKVLRIIPSTLGRAIDPIMDKIFAVSVFAGGTIGGELNPVEAAGILATEAATAGATLRVINNGGKPETSKAGTWGMAGRCGTIVLNFASNAISNGFSHELLVGGGAVTAGVSMVLGALSCRDILTNTEIPTLEAGTAA